MGFESLLETLEDREYEQAQLGIMIRILDGVYG